MTRRTDWLAMLSGALSWQFLSDPQSFTLSMALWGYKGP